ncbi:MAG: PKD domain-containing protein [Cyclobacteriaceae bacterium]|nr:PKD domain-containing protein [Cyclobacteriaceae bacterium]
MKKGFLLLLVCMSMLAFSGTVSAQNCVIISKGNFMDPKTLCAPVDVEWDVLYTGVNNGGAPVEIFIDWDDGTTDLVPGVLTNAVTNEWSVTDVPHVYPQGGSQCTYHPEAFLVVNGVICSSTGQEQIVTVWDTDDENGGDIRIDPVEYRVCVGHAASVAFDDNSTFNCVPPDENDNPNLENRWIQWIYGTGPAANRIPGSQVGGSSPPYPFSGAVDYMPAPVLGPWSTSSTITIPNTTTIADIGKQFEVTLNNWNQCNPYPDSLPVTETARIILVAAPIPDFRTRKNDAGGIVTDKFCAGEQVYFENLTTWPLNSSSGYSWTFYDGPTTASPIHSTGGGTNPQRIFNNPGIKLIELVASDGNAAGSCDEVIQKTIEIIAAPVAQIQINSEPLSVDTVFFCEDQFGTNLVTFTDQSGAATPNTAHVFEFFDENNNLVLKDSVVGGPSGPFTQPYTAPGVYNTILTLTDKDTDCQSFDTAVVVITALPQARFVPNGSGVLCAMDSVFFDDVSTNFTTVPSGFVADTIAVWRWWFDYDFNPLSAPDVVINSGNSGDTSYIFPTAKDYIVRLEVESANGCTDDTVMTVTVNPVPNASFTASPVADCSPLITNLTNTSGPQPAGVVIDRYTWTVYDAVGTVIDQIDQPTEDTLAYTFINTSPDFEAKYAVTLTAVDASGCETTSAADTMTVFPSPIISFTSDDYDPFNNNCAPVSATFNVDSIFHATNDVNTYYWIVNDGAGFIDTTAISGNTPDFLYNNFINVGINIKIYTVTLTADLNTGGCVVPFNQPIIVHPVPVSTFTATPIENCDFVQFQMETIQKAGILIYDWTFSEVPSNNPLLDDSFDLTFERPEPTDPDLTVDVSLVVTNTSSCVSDTTVQTLLVPKKPFVDVQLDLISSDQGCVPYTANFRNATATYPAGTIFELWLTFGLNNPVQVTPTSGDLLNNFSFEFPQNGDYRIELRAVEPTNNCPFIDNELITVFPAPPARFFTPLLGDCAPFDGIFFDDSNDTTIVARTWTVTGPGVNDVFVFNTKQDFTYTFQNNTTAPIDYQVSLTVENALGCTDTKMETITAYPQLQPSFTVNPYSQILPNSTVNITDTSPANNWNYRWDFGDGNFSTDPNTNAYTYATFGQYIITLEVTDPNTNCIGIYQDSIEIIAIPPVVDFLYDVSNGCAPHTVNFTNMSQYASPGTYFWDFGDGIGTSRQQNPTYTYYDPGIYTVSLSASNELDTTVVERKDFIIEVYPESRANFDIRPEVVFLPGEEIRAVNRSEGAESYFWDFGDGNTSTEFEPTHRYERAGEYDVTLIATNQYGCNDTLTIEKAVFADDGGKFLIPNTFTPNGDGKNDVFVPEVFGVVNFHMEIYDRWGELLFVTDDQNNGWDGYYKGRLSTQDVYVYKLKMKFLSGNSVVRTGDVTLLR